jgi:hypothetical protein
MIPGGKANLRPTDAKAVSLATADWGDVPEDATPWCSFAQWECSPVEVRARATGSAVPASHRRYWIPTPECYRRLLMPQRQKHAAIDNHRSREPMRGWFRIRWRVVD